MRDDLFNRIHEMGFKNFLREKFHQRFKLNKSIFKGEGGNSSISDSDHWVGYCNLIAKDEKAFVKFRQYRVLHDVLEHVTFQTANLYLDSIRPRFTNSEILHLAKKFDAVGRPLTYYFHEVGKVSSLFFRYLKVASDIELLFGNKLKVIAEIGVGFGGQLVVLSHLVPFKECYLFDLTSTRLMASKYLRANGILNVNSGNSIIAESYDLVISNFAFSELKRVQQEKYFTNIIQNSRRGYITWNNLSEHYLDGMSIGEFVERKPGTKVVTEELAPQHTNYILIWGIENFDSLWALSGSNRRPTD